MRIDFPSSSSCRVNPISCNVGLSGTPVFSQLRIIPWFSGFPSHRFRNARMVHCKITAWKIVNDAKVKKKERGDKGKVKLHLRGFLASMLQQSRSNGIPSISRNWNHMRYILYKYLY